LTRKGSSRQPGSGSPIRDYEVACQSRTNVSCAPELLNNFRPENGWDASQRAVAIDYPRSCWRIGGESVSGVQSRKRGRKQLSLSARSAHDALTASGQPLFGVPFPVLQTGRVCVAQLAGVTWRPCAVGGSVRSALHRATEQIEFRLAFLLLQLSLRICRDASRSPLPID